MATSNTYALDPSVLEFADEAWERCGLNPADVKFRQARSARRSMNMLLSHWATKGCKLWAVEAESVDCVDGTASYAVDNGTIAILEMAVRRSGSDTPVATMDRDEYLAIPNKTHEGMPTRFYFDRQKLSRTFTLWPIPENSTDDIIFYRLRRQQDVTAQTETLDLPYEWFEAFASGLAAKLAVKWAPDRLDMLEAQAERAFQDAYYDQRERVDTQFRIG